MLPGDVYIMQKWRWGSDWIKHCLSTLELTDECASILLRRVYPFLLHMSDQSSKLLEV